MQIGYTIALNHKSHAYQIEMVGGIIWFSLKELSFLISNGRVKKDRFDSHWTQSL